MGRIILHIDMDSFYASVEELRHPEIKGSPVVICVYSGRTEDSGAVSTANYMAREIGIKAGIPIRVAKSRAEKAKKEGKAKEVFFLPYDIDHYRDISDRIMRIIERHGDVLQQVSIDEAYLDVTAESGNSLKKARSIAEDIKSDIRKKERLTCSVGIGPNKLVAKMASGQNKPDGITVIEPGRVKSFIGGMAVTDIHGIGPKTAEELARLGIKTGRQLANAGHARLESVFGPNKASVLVKKAKGEDDSPVEEQKAKQLSRIGTLKEDSRDLDCIFSKLMDLSAELQKRIEKKGVTFKTISIIAIDTTLDMQTRSETAGSRDNITKSAVTAKALLEKYLRDNPKKELRRVGIMVSGLEYGGTEKKVPRSQKSLGDF